MLASGERAVDVMAEVEKNSRLSKASLGGEGESKAWAVLCAFVARSSVRLSLTVWEVSPTFNAKSWANYAVTAPQILGQVCECSSIVSA